MGGFLLIWFLQSIALLITALLIPRFTVAGPFSALKFVTVLSIINTTLWNASLFSAIPNSFTAHTLVVVLANGALFWGLAKIMPGIMIDGWLPAIVGPIVFTIISAVTFNYGKDVDWVDVFERAADYVTSTRDTLIETDSANKAGFPSEKKLGVHQSETGPRRTPGRAGEKNGNKNSAAQSF